MFVGRAALGAQALARVIGIGRRDVATVRFLTRDSADVSLCAGSPKYCPLLPEPLLLGMVRPPLVILLDQQMEALKIPCRRTAAG